MGLRLAIAIAGLAVCASCGDGGDGDGTGAVIGSDTGKVGEPYAGPLTFLWPGGCSVRVDERIEQSSEPRDGEPTTITVDRSYWMDLDYDTSGLHLGFRDLVVVNVDDMALSARQRLGLRFQYEYPRLLVSAAPDAGFVDAGPWPALQRQARESGLELSSETVEQLTFDSMEVIWATWVEYWAEAGEVTGRPAALAAGSELGSDAGTVESLPVEQGLARLAVEWTSEVDESLGEAGPLFGLDATFGAGDVVEVHNTASAVVEPQTLKPQSAQLVSVTTARIGGQEVGGSDLRRWTFDWDQSDCRR